MMSFMGIMDERFAREDSGGCRDILAVRVEVGISPRKHENS